MGTLYEREDPTDVQDMIWNDSGIALEGLDYVAATELTASNVFSPEQVGVIELGNALTRFVEAANELDKFKKALFRKRNRVESGLPVGEGGIYPFRLHQSLDYALGGMGHDDLVHGIVGVCTESGEMAEILLKLLAGEKVDEVNVKEEIGDVLWYIARLVKWAGTTFLTEMKRNISKLRARHGAGGFSKDGDINRDLASERTILTQDKG